VKQLALVSFLALASCATGYQPQSFTGGFSGYLTAPDEAVIMFHGNGYTSAERVVEMAALRCADITLEHGYRYFVGVGMADLSSNSSFTTPGYASTYGSVFGYGNYATANATTIITPPQRFNIYRPAISVTIRMSNEEKSLEPLGMVIGGQKVHPKDAAFLSQSLRQALGIKSGSATWLWCIQYNESYCGLNDGYQERIRHLTVIYD
jgi:hypothetical protein